MQAICQTKGRHPHFLSQWDMIGLAICLIIIPAGRGSQNTLESLRNQPLQLSNEDTDNPG